MLESAPVIQLQVPVVPGDYVTHALQLGTVQFNQPEPFASGIVDEILLGIEHPPNTLVAASSTGTSEFFTTPPQIEFFRRFNQWFVTVLIQGPYFPMTPFHLLLTHFDRPNRKVYTARGMMTLTRYV